MRVAVAGAGGFIGAACTRALAAAGHDVLGFGRGGPPAGARADVLVWAAGRRESSLAENLVAHRDAPLAAQAALAARIVVYLSSGECYGAAPVPFCEDGVALGDSDYACAKLAGEAALLALHGVRAACLRLGVVYGPGQAPRMLLPAVRAALASGQRFPMSHGEQTRDFVFVDDVAAAVVRAVAAADARGVINVASGAETRVRDACEQLADALGADRALLGFGEVATRPGEALRYVLDVARAERVLGWLATTPLAAGLARLAATPR